MSDAFTPEHVGSPDDLIVQDDISAPATEPTEAEVIEAYLDLRRQGVGEKEAARQLQADHREIAQYAAANPAFAASLADAIDERLERVEERIWRAAQEGDMMAATKVVDSHAPGEWMKPTPEMLIKVSQVDAYTAEQVAVLVGRLEAAQRKQLAIEAEATDGE